MADGGGTWEDSKRQAIARVRDYGGFLEWASEAIRADRDVVLEAVKTFGLSLQYASQVLRADRAIVLEAVSCHGQALQYASEDLRADKAVVLAAVEREGLALRFASEELRADKSVVFEAVKCRGHALQYASQELRSDVAIVSEAMKHGGLALQYASDDLRGDLPVVLEAVMEDGHALRHAKEPLRAQTDVMIEAVKQSGFDAFNWASEEHQRDKDILALAARCSQTLGRFTPNNEEQARILRSKEFHEACRSSLAVRGEDAPILCVTLSRSQNDESLGQTMFRCEVGLMSGKSFECSLGGESSTSRPSPILNDLAKVLVAELPNHSEVSAARVFINFAACEGDEEVQPVSLWDWDRPLTDFLPGPSRGYSDSMPPPKKQRL